MSKKTHKVETKIETPAVVVAPGPELNLPPGTINTTLNVGDVATVLYSGLRRRLKVDQDAELDRVEKINAELKVAYEAYNEALKDLQQEGIAETVRGSVYRNANDAADTITRFCGVACKVEIDAQLESEKSVRDGKAVTLSIVLKIGEIKDKDYTGRTCRHSESINVTIGSNAALRDLLDGVDEIRARKSAASSLAAAFATELRRPDLLEDCKTLVIEQVMKKNTETSAWLGALYERLGLVVDSREVRNQLKLVDAG